MVRDVRVLKFGGTALGDGEAVRRACRIVVERGGEAPLVVVSAHAGVTAMLERAAAGAAAGAWDRDAVRIRHRTLLRQLGLDPEMLDRQLQELFAILDLVQRDGRLDARRRDHVLSFGERMSARTVAAALRAAGVAATPVDSFDLGLVSDGRHGAARPLARAAELVRRAVRLVPGVPVVTGFLASDARGNLTTLGPNGSDLTAAFLAEAIGARELQLWKTVDGIHTADPALVPDARRVPRLAYDEAVELARAGAEVLHPRAVEPALRARIDVRVADVRRPETGGTLLVGETEPRGVVAIAHRTGLARVGLPGAGRARSARSVRRLWDELEEAGIEPAAVRAGPGWARLVVPLHPELAAILERAAPGATLEPGLATLALVGRGVGGDVATAARARAALGSAGAELVDAALDDRPASQSLAVREADLERALRALHRDVVAGARAE